MNLRIFSNFESAPLMWILFLFSFNFQHLRRIHYLGLLLFLASRAFFFALSHSHFYSKILTNLVLFVSTLEHLGARTYLDKLQLYYNLNTMFLNDTFLRFGTLQRPGSSSTSFFIYIYIYNLCRPFPLRIVVMLS